MTIADKLNYLNQTKTAIKEAIINKGVSISDTDTFRSYADKINLISTSKITTGVLPKNILGLDYLLDGEYNLISGSDHSNLNVYNLVKPSYNNTTTGQRDVTNGVVSFTDKSFRPAGTYFLPRYTATEWTFDFVIKLTEAPFDWVDYASLVHCNSGAYNGGYSIHIAPESKSVMFMASTSGTTNEVKLSLANTWNPEKINYWSISSNVNTGETKIYVDGVMVVEATNLIPYKLNTSNVNMGLFGAQSTGVTSNSSNIPTSSSNFWQNGSFQLYNADIYIVRHWNRILSDEEIKINYEIDYNRIGS